MQCHGLQCGFCTPGMMMTAPLAARPQSAPRRSRDPRGHLRQPLPLHRLRQHRPLRPLGRRAPRYRQRRSVRHDNASPIRRHAQPAGNPIGFGRMLRKEDVRFVRGKGNYVDDLNLPGMLHGAILRSPYAHARIVSIDTSAAEAHPKVRAVITGAVLETLKLAWMPTL